MMLKKKRDIWNISLSSDTSSWGKYDSLGNFYYSYSSNVMKVNISTGKDMVRYPAPGFKAFANSLIAFSKDGKVFSPGRAMPYTDTTEFYLTIYNSNGTILKVVKDTIQTFSGAGPRVALSNNENVVYIFYGYLHDKGPSTLILQAFDTETGKKKWSRGFSTPYVGVDTMGIMVTHDDKYVILHFQGDWSKFNAIVNADNGVLVNRYSLLKNRYFIDSSFNEIGIVPGSLNQIYCAKLNITSE